MHEHPDIEVLCLTCAFGKIETEPGAIIAITPAQRQEIEEWREKINESNS